jgi:hypothetical protein
MSQRKKFCVFETMIRAAARRIAMTMLMRFTITTRGQRSIFAAQLMLHYSPLVALIVLIPIILITSIFTRQ